MARRVARGAEVNQLDGGVGGEDGVDGADVKDEAGTDERHFHE